MTPLRRVVAVISVACLLGGAPAAPADVVTGIGSESPSMLSSPWFTGLAVANVRLDVPWNAGLATGPWDSWLQQAHAEGLNVLVALDHVPASNCPYSNCSLVDVPTYEYSLAGLLTRYPWITEIEPWNEPNDSTEPTAGDPAAAASYYEAARFVCPTCTVIAGNMLDGPSLSTYLQQYRAALTDTPAVWGLHDYFDANYFENAGIDTLLASTTGDVWLTETGGLVANGTLPYDETRAAQAVDWIYGLDASRPRVSHVFFYGWLPPTAPGDFDSGLLDASGDPRPAYWEIRAHTNPQHATAPVAAPAAPTAPLAASARPSGRGARLNGRRLVIAIACVAATQTQTCRGTVRLTVVGVSLRASFTVPATLVRKVDVRLGPRTARRLRLQHSPSVSLSFCTTAGCGPRERIRVLR